jgi:hypothetical protein
MLKEELEREIESKINSIIKDSTKRADFIDKKTYTMLENNAKVQNKKFKRDKKPYRFPEAKDGLTPGFYIQLKRAKKCEKI